MLSNATYWSMTTTPKDQKRKHLRGLELALKQCQLCFQMDSNRLLRIVIKLPTYSLASRI